MLMDSISKLTLANVALSRKARRRGTENLHNNSPLDCCRKSDLSHIICSNMADKKLIHKCRFLINCYIEPL